MRLHVITVSGMLAIGGCASTNRPPEPKPLASGESCKLSPEGLASQRQKLIPGLFARAEGVGNVPDGLRLQFANRPGLLTDLAKVMEQELDCCSLLHFRLTTEVWRWPRHLGHQRA